MAKKKKSNSSNSCKDNMNKSTCHGTHDGNNCNECSNMNGDNLNKSNLQ